MWDVLSASITIRIGFAVLALLLLPALLRFFDWTAGVKFGEHILVRLKRQPIALGLYYGLRFVGVALFLARVIAPVLIVAALIAAPARAAVFSHAYDAQIEQAAATWWPGLPWRLLKAQLWQESRLDPTARSGVGAEGLAQFMGPTWADVSRAIGQPGVPRTLAGPAIEGAAYYMAELSRSWRVAEELERHKFAAASYNAGLGNIRKSYRWCQMPDEWAPASACLPAVTGKANAQQTTTYVTRIWRWWQMMESGA